MLPEEKAALLRAGLRQTDPTDSGALDRLCIAIGYLTSPKREQRETAKRRIREIVELGKIKTGI